MVFLGCGVSKGNYMSPTKNLFSLITLCITYIKFCLSISKWHNWIKQDFVFSTVFNFFFMIMFCQGINARSPSGNRLRKDLRVQGHDIKYVYYAVKYILSKFLFFSPFRRPVTRWILYIFLQQSVILKNEDNILKWIRDALYTLY